MNSQITPNSSYKGTLNNYLINLKATENDLYIQAEDNFTSKSYYTKISLSEVSSVSNGLFHTIESFYQGLIDAIDKKEKSASISIDNDATINYKIEVSAGSQKIPFNFELELNEEKITEEQRLLKQIAKLTRKVVEQEKRIHELEEKLSKVEGNIPMEFDPNGPQSAWFNILNSGRTIMSKAGGTWRVMFGKTPLPKHQKSSFSVRIDYVADNHRNIMIGICPSSLKTTQYAYGYNGGFAYFGGGNGQIYKGGIPFKLMAYPGIPGTVIKITTDLIDNTVTFYYDGVWIYASELDTSITENFDYYPFVDLFTNYDKVSFVSFEIEP